MRKALLLAIVVGHAGAYIHVDEKDGRLKDESNREIHMHGVNVVFKDVPWHPELSHFDPATSFCEEDMELLAEWGQNVVRLGIMWPGVEPERGRYNHTYLRVMVDVVKRAWKRGIYTLLDFHQDSLSEKFCGEGVPLWAVKIPDGAPPFPLPLQLAAYEVDGRGVPSREDCARHPWWAYEFSRAGASAYQALYDDEDGLLESFAGYWREVARAFKGVGGVLGLELMNEPFAGDVFRDVSLLFPGLADQKNLARVYDRLHAAIREVDDDVPIFFESVTWSDELGRDVFRSGFEASPIGGPDYRNRSVYSYHYYQGVNLGPVGMYLDARLRDARRWGVGAMVTEFDIGNEEEDPQKQAKVIHSMGEFEARLQSYIGWEYKSFAGSSKVNGTCTGCGTGPWHVDGRRNEMVIDSLTRTYAPLVAGRSLYSRFNSSTKAFALSFEVLQAVTDPTTLIYAHRGRHYPSGVRVEIEPAEGLSWKWMAETGPKANFLVIQYTMEAPPEAVTVHIRPESGGPEATSDV